MAKQVTYRRVYEETSPEDGKRVLVDRVWPRGMRKENTHLDEWLRDVAPSSDLRKWYRHEPSRFAEFRRRYLAELRDAGHRQATQHLRELAAADKLTLLTASRFTVNIEDDPIHPGNRDSSGVFSRTTRSCSTMDFTTVFPHSRSTLTLLAGLAMRGATPCAACAAGT